MMHELDRTHFGDCRDVMRQMIDAGVRVNCIVTSPPYYGLRDYGHPNQLGLEKTPEEYVANMVEVFRIARDLMADDGTLWLNLGDSYAQHGVRGEQGQTSQRTGRSNVKAQEKNSSMRPPPNLKAKDLIGIPWRVAFALQADGWYLRQDIIWNKPNPMPESVRDRCTKAHEYIFLLSKRPNYFFDADAIQEAATSEIRPSAKRGEFNGKTEDMPSREAFRAVRATRNRRSVWTINSQPYAGAHFATFPPSLIVPCIQAGTSAHGHCPKCGAGWARVVEDGEPDLEHQRACGGDRNGEYHGQATKDYAAGGAQEASATKARILAGMREKITTGWTPTCECGTQPVPAIVFDPFMGSGTTAQVAQSLGRNWLGTELNPEYEPLQIKRTPQRGMAI